MNENEMSPLENQLRSWQPRQPSPKIKRRLFPSTLPADTLALSLRWIAPAAACLLLALTIVNQESGLSPHSSRREPMMGVVSSNWSYTHVLPASGPSVRNVVPNGFEWTNTGGYTSSISLFSPARIN